MKKESGLSMIALILIITVIGIVVFMGVKYVQNYIENEKKEDIKTTMLLIQGKITEIANKHTVDEAENGLIGTKLNLDSEDIEYNITDDLKQVLVNLENADLYILSQEDLNNLSVKDVQINKDEFYIVDYNSEDVIYSLGINGKYKLSELEIKKENKETEKIENSETEKTQPEEQEPAEQQPEIQEQVEIQPEATPLQEEQEKTIEQTEIPA